MTTPLYDIPCVFISDDDRAQFGEVARYFHREAGDFNPFKVHLGAHELFAKCKRKFGLRACEQFETWIN